MEEIVGDFSVFQDNHKTFWSDLHVHTRQDGVSSLKNKMDSKSGSLSKIRNEVYEKIQRFISR